MATRPHHVLRRSRRILRLTAAGVVASATLMLAATGGSSGAPAGGFPCSPTSSVTCVFGIPYLDDGNPVHTLDAYYPTNLTDRASIVIIHGGVWKSGSSRSYRHEALYFAENGFAVFVVNYTLSTPEQPSWPQVRTDVESATRWVMGHADEYHGEDVRVGVLGGSSGGHLTALVDTDGPEHGVHPLAAVTWSGAMDLRITYNKGNKAAKNGIYHLLGCRPYECPHKYAAASPVRHVAPGDGSLLFFQSSDEIIPIAGAREMSQALRAAKVPHTLVVFKHSTKHARTYECDPAKVDGAGLPVIDDSLRWLGLQLGQPTTPTGTFCRDPRLSQLKPAGRPTP